MHQPSAKPFACENRRLIGWRICQARLFVCRETPGARLHINIDELEQYNQFSSLLVEILSRRNFHNVKAYINPYVFMLQRIISN